MREYLKKRRESAKLTHQGLAEKTGLSRSNYTNIENGNRQTDMSLSIMEKLAKAFGVSVQTIVKEEMKYKREN